MTLKEKIKQVRASVIAIGFRHSQNQLTIIGSGFAASGDGKILSAAHLYNKLNQDQMNNLMGMAMTMQDELEHYKWLPLKLIKPDDKNDIALLQIENYQDTLLEELELGDSEQVEVGEEVYFIGFPYAAQLINDGFGITLIANKGIISNIKKDGLDDAHPKNWFVIDAISNPGNSGCPLIDIKTNKVIGIMAISFHKKYTVKGSGLFGPGAEIKEPMHICAAKPINLAKNLLRK